MDKLNWTYKQVIFTEDMIGDNYGFVYVITNLITNIFFIGN